MIVSKLHTDTDQTFEVIESLRDQAIQASIAELKEQDRLTMALRAAIKNGIPLDDLSAASGLTTDEIKRRVHADLALGEDLASLTGSR